MNNISLVLIYAIMVLFDLTVLVGTSYLVSEKSWSVWWMLLAVLMCMGSDPKTIISARKLVDVQ